MTTTVLRTLCTDQIRRYCVRFSSLQNNHLSGLQRSYIKLMFKNVQDLMSVRKVIQVCFGSVLAFRKVGSC
jgi:hypothetical protein